MLSTPIFITTIDGEEIAFSTVKRVSRELPKVEASEQAGRPLPYDCHRVHCMDGTSYLIDKHEWRAVKEALEEIRETLDEFRFAAQQFR